ncbi:hypothetical protein SCA03_50050 [Streptomyces cacaoi]|uniref:DUF3558 domain-containing protein n=1 Tax=Streptomyces cacaoi TaxID=1898 RepID=A0A4Y3R4H2_STRCI|nr:hypothetical protein SCA03_50050 [Streptomyces cacaoi]
MTMGTSLSVGRADRWSGWALGAALLVGLAGCGHSQDRDYAVPDDLCGTKVDAELLGPLMPSGVKARTRSTRSGAVGGTCTVDVQRKEGARYDQVLQVKWDVVPHGTEPLKVKRGRLEAYGNPREAAIGDGARVADRGGIAVRSCPARGEGKTLAVEVYASIPAPSDVSERRAAFKRLLQDRLERAAHKRGCAD